MMINKSRYAFSTVTALALAFSSCTRVPDQIEPQVDYTIQDRYLLQLPSPFPPLTTEEKEQSWFPEYTIGMGFAKELNLYQAITSFKRASFLIDPTERKRGAELHYEILLCYYIGNKYDEVIYTFEHSDLYFLDCTFPAYEDLLTILYDCYTRMNEEEKAEKIMEYLQTYYAPTAKKLSLSSSLQKGDLSSIEDYSKEEEYPYLAPFLEAYHAQKKSISKAQGLNALVPGAGYLYLGQKSSALTAFLLNGLFIGASYYFFAKGNIPAGVIFAGFEAGWYFGGIHGAGEEAKFYNERVYEAYATPMMNQEQLFPALSLKYAF